MKKKGNIILKLNYSGMIVYKIQYKKYPQNIENLYLAN